MLSILLALSLARPTEDVLLFVLDDVGLEDLAEARTPHLDALAQTGLTFTTAIANPSCSPTRRSLLFGEWWTQVCGPSCRTQAASALAPPLEALSLPEALPGHVATLFGKWHLGSSPAGGCAAPLDHGFEQWLAGTYSNLKSCGGTDYYRWVREDAPGCHSSLASEYAPRAVRAAFPLAWNRRGPKLAVVCLQSAHDPYRVPPPDLFTGPVGPGERGVFLAMIEAADTLIGQMLADVDLARTLVVVTSDNGTPPDVAPQPTRAKNTTFERGIRVPLIVAGSSVRARGASSALVHLADVYATLVEHGGGVPRGDGLSLGPLLRGETGAHGHDFVLSGVGRDVCVRSTGHKLRARISREGSLEAFELYDLVQDPHETRDQSANPLYAAELRAHLAFLVANLPGAPRPR